MQESPVEFYENMRLSQWITKQNKKNKNQKSTKYKKVH